MPKLVVEELFITGNYFSRLKSVYLKNLKISEEDLKSIVERSTLKILKFFKLSLSS